MMDESTLQPAPSALPPEGAVSRRRWWIAVAVLLAGLLVLVVGVALRARRTQPEPPLADLTGADAEVVEVIQDARDAVLRHRSSAEAWGHLGKLLFAHQFNKEALRCFQQAESLDSREPVWPYLQGRILILGDPQQGIACLDRAVACRPDGSVVHRLYLAEALLEQHRLDEAQTHLEAALQLEPDSLRSQLGFARLAVLREDWRAVQEHLAACRDDVHARRLAHSLQAEAWFHLGQPEKAQAEQQRVAQLPMDEPWPDPFYDKVLELQRGIRARLTRARELSEAGQVNDAINELKQVLTRYPQSVEGWMQLGDIWFRLRKWDSAEACFQKAVHLAPETAEAWSHLGNTQLEAWRELRNTNPEARAPEAVAKSFHTAIRLKPDHALAHCGLGLLLKEQGDRAEAAKELREALHHRPDYEPARKALSEIESSGSKIP
jgi:tetratricopeptide (TPR) repeat protein